MHDGVAYVLKGYPRISEIFIASEIYRLEQLGLPVRLFVLKPADETTTHPVVRAHPGVAAVPAGDDEPVGHTVPPVAAAQHPALSGQHRPCGATPAPRTRPGHRPGSGSVGPCTQTPLRVATQAVRQGAAARDRTGRRCPRRPGYPASARALRARRHHGHVVRIDDHGRAVLVHRARQGHLLGIAQPGGTAASQAPGRAVRRDLHRGQPAAPAPGRARRRCAARLPRPQRRLHAIARCPAAQRQPPRRSAASAWRGTTGAQEGLRHAWWRRAASWPPGVFRSRPRSSAPTTRRDRACVPRSRSSVWRITSRSSVR